MLTSFSRIIEYDKPQATIYNGPQGFLTFTVEVIGSYLTPKWFLKTQLLKKRQPF